MKTYIGINNLSKEARKIYVGYKNKAIALPITGPIIDKKIYGVTWDGSADTFFTRTDDAAGLLEPNPYYNGMTGTPSSPFDEIFPWAGMEISEDANAGTVVSIPKFYYKMEYADPANSLGLKIRISNFQHTGFLCSPAHMDRGDGVGERDVVYVGRYHCNSDFKSSTLQAPRANTNRQTFRTYIHNLGSNVWQWDYATLITIWLLYLVEFADWNSQVKIGFGEPSGYGANSGATDSMPYHTGVSASDKYGRIQYRNIEDLWGNLCYYLDGLNFSGKTAYCIKNPADFANQGGTNVGYLSNYSTHFITGWRFSGVDGYEYAILPYWTTQGSAYTYVCDRCINDTSTNNCAIVGGYDYSLEYGLFYIDGNRVFTTTNATIGSRLMILP